MKVCFYGNTGHFFTAFVAKDRLEDIEFAAYCPGYQGEDMGQLLLFAGQAEGRYPDGWEIHARNGGKKEPCIMKRYESLDTMLDEEKPDILIVDNRFAERYPAEMKAVKRGIHVYVDKPIAMTEQELDELYRGVKEKDLVFWAMDTVRYDAWYYTAKNLI